MAYANRHKWDLETFVSSQVTLCLPFPYEMAVSLECSQSFHSDWKCSIIKNTRFAFGMTCLEAYRKYLLPEVSWAAVPLLKPIQKSGFLFANIYLQKKKKKSIQCWFSLCTCTDDKTGIIASLEWQAFLIQTYWILLYLLDDAYYAKYSGSWCPWACDISAWINEYWASSFHVRCLRTTCLLSHVFPRWLLVIQ